MCICLCVCVCVCVCVPAWMHVCVLFFINPFHLLISLTNVIIVQRLTSDNYLNNEEVTIEKDQTQMITRKERSVMLNEVPILEYHAAKRVGPSLPPFQLTIFRKLFLKIILLDKKEA